MKLFSSPIYSLGAVGLLILAATSAVQAQTGIGTRTPDESSALDITSTNRGLLIPRVELRATTDGTTIPNPANSLLVYNTSSALAGPGFYFNAGSPGSPNWERFVSSGAPVGLEFWRTNGNPGTDPANNFLGTTDARDLAFRVGNTEYMRLLQNGTLNLTSAAVANGVTIGNTLNVGGASVLAGLSAGPTSINSTLSVIGIPTFATLGGVGTRLVVADNLGNLTTQAIPSAEDAVLNQNTREQIANFWINGSGKLGSALTVGGTLGVTGASTLNNTLNVTGATTLGSTLGVSGNSSLSTLSTSGLAALASARVTNLALAGAGNRVVIADANGNLITGTAANGGSGEFIQNQTGANQNASFRISGSGQIGNGLTVEGDTKLRKTVIGTNGQSSTLDVNGDVTISGRLSVTSNSSNAGTFLRATTIGNPSDKSDLVVNGDARVTTNATIGGTLGITGATTVTGASTLNGTTTVNNTLTVTGNTGLSTLNTTNLATLASARVSNLGGGGSRMVVTNGTGDLSAVALPGSAGEFIANTGGATPSFNITGSGQIGSTLNVTGITTLRELNAGTTTLSSAVVSNSLSAGSLSVGGATALNSTLVVAGATQLRNLGINQGNRLVITDGSGNLSTQAIPTPIDAILNQTGTSQSASFNLNGSGQLNSLTVNGASNVGGNHSVSGALGVIGLSTLNSLGVTTSAAVGGTLGVTGNTTLSSLSTSGLATLASARVANLTTAGMVVNDANGNLTTRLIPDPNNAILNQSGTNQSANFQIDGLGQVGTLSVMGNSSLNGLTAGTTTLSSANVTGALSAGASTLSSANVTGALSVDGTTTLKSTLGVTGTTTLAGLTAGITTLGAAQVANLSGTGTRLVVTDGNGTLSAQEFPSPGIAILNQNAGPQSANFNISGSGQVGTTLGVGTALSVGTTLGVTGATTLNNSLAVTGTSVLTGNVGIGTAAGVDALTVNGNVVPADAAYTLGTDTRKWATVFTVNGLNQTSDARLKTNITGLGYGLNTVMALRPVRYAWKKTPNQPNKIGFIAQELQKVVPEVVSVGTDANQTLGVNYAELVPVLVKALQEQQAQLDTMRGRAEKAEAAVQSFESRLRALEAGSSVNATAQGQR